MKKWIGIVGGGAAGMMAATVAAREGGEVVLFERNAYLGAKVIISGGGRCNVTSGLTEVRKLLENYPRGAKFLRKAMYDFSPKDVMEWFEKRGVNLKIENDLRVFPFSNNGKDVVRALERELDKNGVKKMFNSSVVECGVGSGTDHRKFFVEVKGGEKFWFDKLILACGGNAYRQTGSKGDGYGIAKSFGHSIVDTAASLSAFLVMEKDVAELAGISFKVAEIRLHGEKEVYKRVGPMLFTHKGITGPAVFAVSAFSAYELINENWVKKIEVDMLPWVKKDELDFQVRKRFEQNGAKMILNCLADLAPVRVVEKVLERAGVSGNLKAAEVSKESRKKIVKWFKAFELNVKGRSAGDEFVTAGGVLLKEVDEKTMESKLVKGLYFAGELLDFDGLTGGFNLQAAWASGRLAGLNAAKNG